MKINTDKLSQLMTIDNYIVYVDDENNYYIREKDSTNDEDFIMFESDKEIDDYIKSNQELKDATNDVEPIDTSIPKKTSYGNIVDNYNYSGPAYVLYSPTYGYWSMRANRGRNKAYRQYNTRSVSERDTYIFDSADSAWDTLSYFKAPNDYYILKVLLSNGKYIGRGE